MNKHFMTVHKHLNSKKKKKHKINIKLSFYQIRHKTDILKQD